MMPITSAGLIVFALGTSALAPACAQDTFYTRYTPNSSDAGNHPSLDNAFYGITRHASGEYSIEATARCRP